jgi:hypothetical protein
MVHADAAQQVAQQAAWILHVIMRACFQMATNGLFLDPSNIAFALAVP